MVYICKQFASRSSISFPVHSRKEKPLHLPLHRHQVMVPQSPLSRAPGLLCSFLYSFFCFSFLIWATSRICLSSRGHANLLGIFPILEYVLLNPVLLYSNSSSEQWFDSETGARWNLSNLSIFYILVVAPIKNILINYYQ